MTQQEQTLRCAIYSGAGSLLGIADMKRRANKNSSEADHLETVAAILIAHLEGKPYPFSGRHECGHPPASALKCGLPATWVAKMPGGTDVYLCWSCAQDPKYEAVGVRKVRLDK